MKEAGFATQKSGAASPELLHRWAKLFRSRVVKY